MPDKVKKYILSQFQLKMVDCFYKLALFQGSFGNTNTADQKEVPKSSSGISFCNF